MAHVEVRRAGKRATRKPGRKGKRGSQRCRGCRAVSERRRQQVWGGSLVPVVMGVLAELRVTVRGEEGEAASVDSSAEDCCVEV